MHRSRRARFSTPLLPASLRVVVLLALSLLMALQPVLASVGELHELAHDPSGMHSHGLHADDIAAERVAERVPADTHGDEDSTTLHVLLHFAHCTGQATATMLPGMRFAPVTATCPAMAQAQVVSQTRMLAPFRPPITI